MAYKFKNIGSVEALAEVPENAYALVEVDGALKRVPGSGLGGGGNDEYDLVITDDEVNGILSIDSGSYENVYNKIMVAKEPPKILIKYYHEYGAESYGVTSSLIYADIVSESDDYQYLYIEYGNYQWHTTSFRVFPDGTIE